MTAVHNDSPGGSRLRWALRHHARPLAAAALLVLALTAAAVARLVLLPQPYTATAAVIASDLEFSAERVPRLAEAIYQQDGVLRDALRRGQLPWTVDELRDEHAAVIPLEDNVLVNVVGRADDPQLAVRTANSVATALAVALQTSGTEATFAVQERAVRAVQDSRLVPVAVTVVAGLVATAAVVLGLTALLLAVHRPVTRASEVRRITGAPVLSVVHLPRRGRSADPLPGLAALQQELDRCAADVIVLTAPPDAARARSTVAVSYAHLLGRTRDVTLVGSATAVDLLVQLPEETRVLEHDRSQPLPRYAGTTVVDGFDDERAAFRERLPSGGVVVLVLPEGTPEDDLVTVLDRSSPRDLAGVVFVNRRARWGDDRRLPAGRTRWTAREDELRSGTEPVTTAQALPAAGPADVPLLERRDG